MLLTWTWRCRKDRKVDKVAIVAPTVHVEEDNKQKTWAEEMELCCSEEGDIITINENPEYLPSVHPVLPIIKIDPKTEKRT